MHLVLKRSALDDYDVLDNGEVVGRIFRIHNSELWRWTARLQEPTGGVTDSLDQAKAAFRAAWDAHGVKFGLAESGRESLAANTSVYDPSLL